MIKNNTSIKLADDCIIGENVVIGDHSIIGAGCIIEENVKIGKSALIEARTIIRSGTVLGDNAIIGSNCIIGEHTMNRYHNHSEMGELHIGDHCLIRSGTVIYTDSSIENNVKTGHNVVIREKSIIGQNVSVGTLCDIQGDCKIGDYVRLHSNVHVGQKSVIDDFVWIFPYVILTNDPTPPSENLLGVHIHSFAIVATNSILLPGVEVFGDSLIGAGAIVTKNVEKYSVVVGNPAKCVGDTRNIKSKITGKSIYPWRNNFKRNMPWSEAGFEAWYNSLSIDQKVKIEI